MKVSISCLVALFFVSVLSQKVRFDNYTVYRLTPRNEEQIKILRHLDKHGLKVDFWKSPTYKNVTVDIMVSPDKKVLFREIINNLKMEPQIMIDNVQRLIDVNSPKAKKGERFNWDDYYRLDVIYGWLDDLAKKYPEKVSVIIGGRSFEGRDIKGVKLSYREGNKGVFIEGGIHAREWISPATVTYILNELLTSQEPGVREIATTYDWYIFPSVNPDGYEYTHTTNRLWRMTLQPHGNCFGADPNRNWAYHWNDGGASNNPCDETYAGPHPFSEPEMKSLSEYITSIHDKLIGYLAIHSYSQLLMMPYGFSNAHVENYEDLMKIGKKAIESLSKRYGTKYIVGNMAETIYVASGVSPDWVKGNYKIPITYTYELRDTGRHGFVLPPEQIIPTGEETLDSLVTLMLEAKALGYK